MTRKRFIKLLMANGYSRDGAAALADYAQMSGESYAEAFQRVSVYGLLNTSTIEAFNAAMERMAEMIIESAAVVAERLPIIIQSITETIDDYVDTLQKEEDTE